MKYKDGGPPQWYWYCFQYYFLSATIISEAKAPCLCVEWISVSGKLKQIVCAHNMFGEIVFKQHKFQTNFGSKILYQDQDQNPPAPFNMTKNFQTLRKPHRSKTE